MDAKRRQEINERWSQIDDELAAIAEGKTMPDLDPASREEDLLDERDALEFELGLDFFRR